MAISKQTWLIVSGCQIVLLESFAEATQSSGQDKKINDSLVIGIFIGVWIGIACYTLTGWIVDISRKRHIFCKRTPSDKETGDIYNYATSETPDNQPTPRYTDMNDLHKEEGSDQRNHPNSYTESLYVDMSKKRDNLKAIAMSNTHGDSKYIDMSNKHGNSKYIDMSNKHGNLKDTDMPNKHGDSLYMDMSNKHGHSQYIGVSNKSGDAKYMDMNGLDKAANNKANPVFIDVRL